jgi:hypothetical protein
LTLIGQDWLNLTTRKLIHVYPEIPEDGVIHEIWHAHKWQKTMDLDRLSSMWDSGKAHFYVHELSQLQNGNFVIPIWWLKFWGKVCANALLSLCTRGSAEARFPAYSGYNEYVGCVSEGRECTDSKDGGLGRW